MNEEKSDIVEISERFTKKELIILASFILPAGIFYKSYEHVEPDNEVMVLFIFITVLTIPAFIFLYGYICNNRKDKAMRVLKSNLKEVISYKDKSIKKIHEIKAIFKSDNTENSSNFDKKMDELEMIINKIKRYDNSMPDISKINSISNKAGRQAIERRTKRKKGKK